MTSKILFSISIIALISLGGWKIHGQTDKTSNGISYEYHVLEDPTETRSMEDGLRRLNELGAQGWELAGVSRGEAKVSKLYLKRTRR